MFNFMNPYQIVRELIQLSRWGRWFVPTAAIIIIYVCAINNSSWWETLSAIAGLFCVVLVADRKLTNFFWGLINCSLYGLASYNSAFYGDMALNWVLYVPFQFIGLYLWNKNSDYDDCVESKALDSKALSFVVPAVLCAIFLGASLLASFNGAHPMLDSSNVVLSVTATILMALRYREQWVCWILVNLTGIGMWTWNLTSGNGEGIAALAMWSAFLVNSCYGFYSWTKAQK